ncbi:Bug family tripartite tricarboxylate transporter substrate binding protein [Sedimentitalea arenosa]|uniref:Tripartite tricarboxylate transporter substrate binding protein n=1 Tax=Sedimentitalea arenosa TaxID=2798803 RepID=A0A8J7LVG1_9RHOB|nr:tripartite tricarboxylate transporter substrate binding protein [Arenibacterium arenosum]MBJ6370851.1 tripartite tricarboxylate transporter substrate binding protein [Arenibacterium arenosum]
MKITKRLFVKLAGATALAGMIAGPAAAWEPTKPVDFVIMAGAGGGADQIARFIQSVAEKKDLTNRPLVPNNKGGGSGAEALIALNGASDPDHTILVTLNSFFTTPLRQENLGIDVQTFSPIAMMGVDPFVLWVHKDSGITSFEQWLEEVKKGDYIMGGTGKGQEDSLVITYLEQAFDLDIKYIPYKGGGAVAKDLAGKQIMATVNNPAETKGFYAAGDVVPLLSFSDERMPAFPDVPTLKEKGHDFSYYNQRAVVGAPGQSDEAAAYYQDLFKTIYDSQEWQDYMTTESLSPLWMSPDEQKAYWQTQVERHKELLAAMGE